MGSLSPLYFDIWNHAAANQMIDDGVTWLQLLDFIENCFSFPINFVIPVRCSQQ